ncbi:hypothetical protein PFISCL1PPCAC_25529, partial [Pristionchus fissidentatus]
SIFLASPSTLFTISLLNNDCKFWLSSDMQSLMIEKKDDAAITGVEIKLMREMDNEILSSLLLPIRSPSSLISLRIDSWISQIFECGDTVGLANERTLSVFEFNKSFEKKFFLILNPISGIFIDYSLHTEIYSGFLKMGSTSLAVSREV